MKSRLLLFGLMLALSLVSSATNHVPEKGVMLPGIDEETMKARLDESALQPLEGIWEYPSENMTLAIEKCDDYHGLSYRIIMLASDDLELLPGTIVGYVSSSAVDNKFQLWLYTERDQTNPIKPLECVATLNSEASSLTFEKPHYEIKVRVNIVRLFSSIFKGVSITPNKVEEQLPVGFKKVYPANGNGNAFNEIRYL